VSHATRCSHHVTDRLVQAIVLVDDLATARASTEQLGFAVPMGGRHPGRGTGNLIVAFGEQYLEPPSGPIAIV
jgi:hypothetical protein